MAANTLAKFGAFSTTHEIAGRFGGKLLRATKVLRGLGKLAGGVALGFSIYEVADACRVRDAAWAAKDKIGQHLNLIIENLNAKVQGLLNQGSDDEKALKRSMVFLISIAPFQSKVSPVQAGWMVEQQVSTNVSCLILRVFHQATNIYSGKSVKSLELRVLKSRVFQVLSG